MRSPFGLLFVLGLLLPSVIISGNVNSTLSVYLGYLTQIHCRGRLFLSSVGNSKLLHLEAIPKEIGCGVVLQSKGQTGTTDLLLKTSTGDFHFILEIKNPPLNLRPEQLEVEIEAASLKGVSE